MRLKIFLLVCLVAEIYSDDREGKSELTGVQPAIIGGHYAHSGQVPYLVSVQVRTTHYGTHTEKHVCGGAIIDARWILTAVHCHVNGETLVIKAGKHDITKKESNEQVVLVKKAIPHKDYNKNADNDIALLLLEHPLTLNQHVAKIDLPAQDSEPTGRGILFGWGTSNPANDTQNSAIVKTLKLAIIDRDTCNKLARKVHHTFIKSQFCAKGHPPGAGGCAGDSGGPLVFEKDHGHKEIIGIFSWAFSPCGRKNALDAFTKVSSYVHWIHTVMGEHK